MMASGDGVSQPGECQPGGTWWADAPWDGEPWDEDEFDPEASPPDGADAWLDGMPPELRAELRSDPLSDSMADSMGGTSGALGAGFVHAGTARPGTGFAAGGVLDQLPPGPVLAGFVGEAQAAGLSTLTDSEMVGVIAASRRLASLAAAQEVTCIIALARRRAAESREHGDPGLVEHVNDELAAALTLTGRAADRLVEISAGLARLPGTLAALAAGSIDWPRAVVMADELSALSDEDALAVERQVLGRAGEWTTGQLRGALRRAALRVDPAAASRRRRAARKDTGVHAWSEPSGNSALAGRELPSAEVIAADQRITALALWLQKRGAEGTMDQLRAGVFTALLSGRPITSLLPEKSGTARQDGQDGPPTGRARPDAGARSDSGARAGSGAQRDSEPSTASEPGRPPEAFVSGTINLTMPLAAFAGLSDAPGEVPGIGPIDADACRDLATWLAANPRTRWCVTLTDQDGKAAGHACARHGPGPPGPLRGPLATNVIASWLRVLRPEPLASGTCAHRLRVPGYRPPPRLRHLVTVRQRTCGFRGCRRPAVRCDLDHTIPHDQGGGTCECNLAPLCRRHHRAKQTHGWRLAQAEPGVLTWTLPSGRSYTTTPDPYPT
jgi:hypothetical protein